MPGTNRMNAECLATHVILVSSGIYGDKLLFVYPFTRIREEDNNSRMCSTPQQTSTTTSTNIEIPHHESEPYKKQRQKPTLTKVTEKLPLLPMTEFTFRTDILGYILLVQKDAIDKPFELKVDNFRFVAWPKSWSTREQTSSGKFMFSIVFALKTSAETHTVEAYQRLSKKLAISFVTLQHCEGYLEEELRIMEDVDHDCKDPFEKLYEQSKMARTIREVFDKITKYGSVHKYINDFVEIGFCDEAYSLARNNVMPKGRKEIKNIVKSIRPYHGILLLEDVLPTPDANPSVALLLRHCSPDRSILDMSTASGIPIFEVFMIVRHLLLWTRAILIYPLCNTNVYTSATSPQPLEKMIEKFAETFGANIHLAAGLAHFNPPARLDTFIRPNLALSEQQVRAKLVVALLRHQMLMQSEFQNKFQIQLTINIKIRAPFYFYQFKKKFDIKLKQ
ncbi:unnamed protein product [Caenorhabditis angaria]|uniref:GATOR complex protein NPRL3 n=1 Tax=Caenorhabditis angaria TaxID=860376 RepID=A0A9P1N4R8_9PELO|nr:unnamed protein product [Caenorhabditis angaria]